MFISLWKICPICFRLHLSMELNICQCLCSQRAEQKLNISKKKPAHTARRCGAQRKLRWARLQNWDACACKLLATGPTITCLVLLFYLLPTTGYAVKLIKVWHWVTSFVCSYLLAIIITIVWYMRKHANIMWMPSSWKHSRPADGTLSNLV